MASKRSPVEFSRPEAPCNPRFFKTGYFAKQAGDAGITDDELCKAGAELEKGQGDALGGGVWKKRLDKNRYRSIVITKAGVHWIFVFLFAKKDRGNISSIELVRFKKLSKDYSKASAAHIDDLLIGGRLEEICHESESQEGQ